MKKILSAIMLMAATVFAAPAYSAEINGSITIEVKEYERLKNLAEGSQKKQYWRMTFEQILEKEGNNFARAYDLYEFWVLRRIYLSGQVHSGSVATITSQINTLNNIGDNPITLVVRSPGGGVLEGMSLLNLMANSPAPINTVCDSYAFSMGAVIFAAGKHRVAENGCIFMIHEVGVGAPGGKSIEHVKWTDSVINIEDQLVDVLANVSGLDNKEVRTLMEYETFWNAEETYRLGFADEVRAKERVAEERDIPADLLPINRMKKNFNKKLNK